MSLSSREKSNTVASNDGNQWIAAGPPEKDYDAVAHSNPSVESLIDAATSLTAELEGIRDELLIRRVENAIHLDELVMAGVDPQ